MIRTAADFIRRALHHTRIVQSGSPPLYRLLIAGTVISGVVQAKAGDVPESVTNLMPDWADWAFIGAQLLAGVLILWGLYSFPDGKFHAQKLGDSLGIERLGLSLLMSVIAVNIVAVVFYYHRVPNGIGSWWQIMFWFWGWTRLWEIHKALKELTR